jgi:hypothetical protein
VYRKLVGDLGYNRSDQKLWTRFSLDCLHNGWRGVSRGVGARATNVRSFSTATSLCASNTMVSQAER